MMTDRPDIPPGQRLIAGRDTEQDQLRWIVRDWVGSDPSPMDAVSDYQIDQLLSKISAAQRGKQVADEDLCPHGFPPAQRCPYCNEEARPR